MKKNLQKLIKSLKGKNFIFINGYPGVGKTKLINILKKEKEFKKYHFEEWSDYLENKQNFSLKEPKFIEIKNIVDIDFLLSKSKNPDEVIRNFWKSGILINLNIRGHEINDSQGRNYYAYAFQEKEIISIENFFDNNEKILDIYITDLHRLNQGKMLFVHY